MRLVVNDRWTGTFVPEQPGRYVYAIEAWTDEFATWRHGFEAKLKAGQDVTLDALEGAAMLTRAQASGDAAEVIQRHCGIYLETGAAEPLLSPDLELAMADSQARPDLTRSALLPLVIDRRRARAGAWYEMVPRSQSRTPGRHGTFRDCIARLPDIAAMGFDVLYFTPIHPIGQTNRKGRNNALTAEPGDPGSPYAIGAAEGGHDAVHPELGTLEDFRALVAACRLVDIEVALDIAVQCSPDHPWLQQHPDWFRRRPDGTMRYAENPPKKYEDIVNPDFANDDAGSLWNALRDVLLFWVEQGVQDLPGRQSAHQAVPILGMGDPRGAAAPSRRDLPGGSFHPAEGDEGAGEARLHPVLHLLHLAHPKVGDRAVLARTDRLSGARLLSAEFLRQHAGHPALSSAERRAVDVQGAAGAGRDAVGQLRHLQRLRAAARHEPIPGKEEYLNSEKYEIKVRDWDQPGNLKSYIRDINRARRANAALLQTANLNFVPIDDDNVIGFVKQSVDGSNTVAVAIALSRDAHEFWFPFGDTKVDAEGGPTAVVAVENLITGERLPVEWGGLRLRIDPARDPALLFRCLA